MHIPDGYLSPQTCATFGAAMVPAWYTAGRQVKKVVKSRYVPLLALGSAYCFLVMMFNVPIPDGTTAHAVGAVLVAVLLGPWAAVIAVSTALLIQALFFGDGGVLAYGANCFNMAFVMPMVGYAVYRLLTRNVSLTSSRRAVAGGIGAYVGLNVAALCAAIELGVQPELFEDAHGTPLYAPFHLAQTIPAMLAAHLLVAGVVEAALTAGVIAYLQRANLPVLRINHAEVPEGDDGRVPVRRLGWRWAWIGLGIDGAAHAARTARAGWSVRRGGTERSRPAEVPPRRRSARSAALRRLLAPRAVRQLRLLRRRPSEHRLRRFGALRHRDDRARAARVRQGCAAGQARAEGVGVTATQPTARPATPDWLLAREVGLCPCGCSGLRRRGSFVAKTLDGVAGVLRQAMFAEDTAGRPGLLQRLDARVKVLTILALLIAVSLVHSVPVLVIAYLSTLPLALRSKIPLPFFVKRVWLFVPIFTGIVVLPATLNVVTPGEIVVPLGTWFGHPVGMTSQGMTSAALIVTRVATSISLVVLLTLTTSWTKLLAALRSLFVPRIFILVLGMAYRYVFHLLTSVTDMYEARRARSAGAPTEVRSGRAFVAASAGALFGKTHALSEEVHMAMVSRGYTGDARSLQAFTVRAVDIAWMFATAATIVVLLGLDRVL